MSAIGTSYDWRAVEKGTIVGYCMAFHIIAVDAKNNWTQFKFRITDELGNYLVSKEVRLT